MVARSCIIKGTDRQLRRMGLVSSSLAVPPEILSEERERAIAFTRKEIWRRFKPTRVCSKLLLLLLLLSS
jgi:hypothetical protein